MGLAYAVIGIQEMAQSGNPKKVPPNGELIAHTSENDQVAQLEKDTPAFDRESGEWVKSKRAAEIECVETSTLATYRKQGIKNTDESLGRGRYGRVWRRPGTPRSHPWYLRPTLVSQWHNRG